MKLLDLSPQFYRCEIRNEKRTQVVGDPLTWKSGDPTEEVIKPCEYHIRVDTLVEAQGIMFTCPCGDHQVLCWFYGKGVPDEATPGPGRWSVLGTSYHDLTLGPGPSGKSSIQLLGEGCKWHGHVINGSVTTE